MEIRGERFLTVAVVLAICLAAVAGSGTVFYQTRLANPTVEEYFSFLNLGRLLVLSHVHAFGYAVIGFVLWTLGRRQGAARDGRFAPIVGLTVLAGLFDVLSWWAVVYLDPVFRFLTFAAGGGFVGGVLLSASIVLHACRKTRSY